MYNRFYDNDLLQSSSHIIRVMTLVKTERIDINDAYQWDEFQVKETLYTSPQELNKLQVYYYAKI